MAWRVDEVQAVAQPIRGDVLKTDGARLDGDALLAFQVHRVEDLADHLALVEGMGHLEEAISQRRLAVVNVGDDREVAQACLRDAFHGAGGFYQATLGSSAQCGRGDASERAAAFPISPPVIIWSAQIVSHDRSESGPAPQKTDRPRTATHETVTVAPRPNVRTMTRTDAFSMAGWTRRPVVATSPISTGRGCAGSGSRLADGCVRQGPDSGPESRATPGAEAPGVFGRGPARALVWADGAGQSGVCAVPSPFAHSMVADRYAVPVDSPRARSQNTTAC